MGPSHRCEPGSVPAEHIPIRTRPPALCGASTGLTRRRFSPVIANPSGSHRLQPGWYRGVNLRPCVARVFFIYAATAALGRPKNLSTRRPGMNIRKIQSPTYESIRSLLARLLRLLTLPQARFVPIHNRSLWRRKNEHPLRTSKF